MESGSGMTHEESDIKQQVRQFYDQVGWQVVSDGMYQNARYEDLRPVAREYVSRCHLRVKRYLLPSGRFLLDAGSGPIQYPEYLTYSEKYRYRVCADISIVALQEARKRIGDRGLFVVADVANLPFKTGSFDGVVSLHTLHHLPAADHEKAYSEIYRVLKSGTTAVIVNGWTESRLMRRWNWLVILIERFLGRKTSPKSAGKTPSKQVNAQPTGTFIQKFDPSRLYQHLNGKITYEVRVWRSVSVRFMRAIFHRPLGGRFLFRVLYAFEERFPRYFGENGQYPLIILRKD